MSNKERSVFIVKCFEAAYGVGEPAEAPELVGGRTSTIAERAVRTLLAEAGFDQARLGSSEWNPLGELINPGDRVVIKPNWVLHYNKSGSGMDSLVTHTSILAALVSYVAAARPRSIIVGDAPIQGCDFNKLIHACRLGDLSGKRGGADPEVVLKDFRRTIMNGEAIGACSTTSSRSDEDYSLFDLGTDSDLEPISRNGGGFRVTMYNPDQMQRTHAPGRHQYLVAREVIEADVVINVPKLKTHKKAGITGALKNLVGINGLKDYLPHHRIGGSLDGGDCYKGTSRIKSFIETMLDAANRAERPAFKRAFVGGVRLGQILGRFSNLDDNLEGAWHGNDTVWRMCLDLQRILHYGRVDGSLAEHKQRRVLTITDAIIAGDGDGPLAPNPVPLGIMTMSLNTAAADWFHSLLMGFDPQRIPLVREAFAPHRYPLVDFGPDEILVEHDGRASNPKEAAAKVGLPFRAPDGWRGFCEQLVEGSSR